MTNIVSYDGSISIIKTHTFDSLGVPELEVDISSDNSSLIFKIDTLEEKINSLQKQFDNDSILRQKYPALQDVYKQYQVMLGLVKEVNGDE